MYWQPDFLRHYKETAKGEGKCIWCQHRIKKDNICYVENSNTAVQTAKYGVIRIPYKRRTCLVCAIKKLQELQVWLHAELKLYTIYQGGKHADTTEIRPHISGV
jgi:hypothetical protein